MIDKNNIDINKIPKQVIFIIKDLHENGYEGWLVGGAIRDLLLDREPKDWDIASNCPLEKIQEIFPNVKIVGASFGVALVNFDGMDIQVARFRTDGIYEDSRHPSEVNFVDDIMEDLKRRDLTINSFAYDPITEDFVYTNSALFDLENKIIRFVGNGNERCQEDALRMLRCVRFSCQLGFKIEHSTEWAIVENYKLINNISMERIQEEFNKILLSNNPKNGIHMLYNYSLMEFILPELIDCQYCSQNIHHRNDVYYHILQVVELVPNDLSMRLTALFHDIGKPATKTIEENGHVHFYGHDEVSANMAKEIMTRLKYDNQMIDEVAYLVAHHMELMNYPMLTGKGCRKLLNRHGESRLRKLIEFRRADLLGSGTRNKEEVEELIEQFRSKLEEVLEEKPATSLVDLAIDGNDIMEVLNIISGKEVGKIKNQLMEAVLDNPELNTRDRLLNMLEGIAILKDFEDKIEFDKIARFI